MNEQVNYAKIQRIQDNLEALTIGTFGTGFVTDAMMYESGIKATVAQHTSDLADITKKTKGILSAESFNTIQEAVDYAKNNGYSDVYLGHLQYTITQDLVVPSGITIRDGQINIGTDGVSIYLNGTKPRLNRIVINDTRTSGYTVRLVNTNGAIIEDSEILGNHNGMAIICTTKAINTTIRRVKIPYIGMGILFNDEGNRNQLGVDYTGQAMGYGLYIYDCQLGETDKTKEGDGVEVNCPLFGFYDVIVKNNIVGCAKTTSSNGIGLGFANCENVIVESNIVRKTDGAGGIHIEKGFNTKVINNSIYDSYRGISVETTTNSLIQGNAVYRCQQGIMSYNSTTSCESIRVLENYLEEITSYAILFTNAKFVKIVGNTINRYKGSTGTGIIQLNTQNTVGVILSEISRNRLIKGSDGVTTTSLIGISTESVDNEFIDNYFDGYDTGSFNLGITNNRVIHYARGTGRKGGEYKVSGSPVGYVTPRAGALATDITTGDIYRANGTAWTKIL